MAKKKKRSVTIIGAWIAFAGVIIAGAIAIIPQILPEKQKSPELKHISRYDDLSGLFSIELPSVFKLKEREQIEDDVYVTFHLDEEQINFDAPEENYHVVFLYIQVIPLPEGVVFDEYMIDAINHGANEIQFNEAMKDFRILDTLFIGDSTVINNEKTDKGFFIKKLITNINHDLLPKLDKGYIFELNETEPTGFAQVYMFLNEQAYLDYSDAMETAVKSFKWDLTPLSR
jgi:hypothetical protein